MNPPSREGGLLVFAQRSDARVDIHDWNAHATRFFSTRIGLTTEKRYAPGDAAPLEDDAVFVVAPDGEPAGVRRTFARRSEFEDHELAAAAEANAAYTGLSLLARRCEMVWLVVREGNVDPLALRLAAILASVLLGPILDTAAGELFGAKTARAKLAAIVRA